MDIMTVSNLCYSYDDKKALDNVNFSIKKGEITAVLGGNGAGKSTLFLNLNGVLKPDSGKVFFENEEVIYNSKNIKKLSQKIGIVFQDPNDQIFSDNVKNDIAFGAINMGIPKEEVEKMVIQVSKQTGVYDLLDKPTHALSFGQKKRVAIAGVLIMKPCVIILDEPTAGLDPNGVSEILHLLLNIKNDTGISIVISTHEIDIVPIYCSYAYVLHNGKVVLNGTPDKIFENPDQLRKYNIRTPRIMHLMEILNKEDNLPVDVTASTISKARATIKELINNKNFIVKNGKQLKCGYTTGSCATAASYAATIILLSKNEVEAVEITLPNDEKVQFFIDDINITPDYVSCCVIKNAGDDPDITDKAKIYSKVKFANSGINIYGGKGVGTVTAKGLQCSVGESAINPVPKQMIIKNVSSILNQYSCNYGLDIEISVENGEELAKKTFNERLGIVGGISILGTTGIVEPMSEKALVDTIKITIDKQYVENNDSIVISPGNYGADYCKNNLNLDIKNTVKISNYIGEALDYIKYKKFKNVLLVGHIGKLVKLAGGVMNTHSSIADCRMEIISTHCALCGGSQEMVSKIMKCITCDEAFDLIKDSEIYEDIKKSILEKVLFQVNYRLKNEVNFDVIMFNTDGTHVIKSEYSLTQKVSTYS